MLGISVYTIIMFSWDARKALKNSRKHGVLFEEASTIFSDPDGLDWEDLEHAHAGLVATVNRFFD